MASIRARPRKDGSTAWAVLWRDADGRQTSMPFEDRQQAENYRRILEANGGERDAAARTVSAIYRKVPTVAQVVEDHIAASTRANERTRHDYLRDARAHIFPALGAVPIDALTKGHVQRWLAALGKSPLSDKSIKNVSGVMASAMKTAVADGLLPANPCAGVALPRRSHDGVEMAVIRPQEWATLDAEIGRVQDGHYQLLFRTLVQTGLRWGEAAALEVGSLSLRGTAPSLRVSQAVRRDAESRAFIGPTKTRRSERVVSLPAELVVELRHHVAGRGREDLVFQSRTGKMLHYSNVRNWVWAPAVIAAMDPAHGDVALPGPLRIHDLRHTHASWLIGAGVDIFAVQRRLGHESIKTTVDRYTHLMPAAQKAAADAISAALSHS